MSASYPHEGTRTPRWPAVAMAASWIIGILWIIVWYVDPTLPIVVELGNWNLLIGFAIVVLGSMVFALILAVAAIVSARRQP
ncbi:cell division protein CrgA [Sphaerisporangium sp. B11E5]|uniref:cell division protein CrgA n=1 Tax=Sphaerisporangium sp. B11E5 TaxID=3153563 RepID=UPI00325D7AE3